MSSEGWLAMLQGQEAANKQSIGGGHGLEKKVCHHTCRVRMERDRVPTRGLGKEILYEMFGGYVSFFLWNPSSNL